MNFEHLSDDYNIERRTFVKGVGATAGATALGLSAGTGAAHGGFHAGHANFRVQEAQKAWARGYRGRADRSIGITDSGVDARHPDLGPWNGIRATPENGELVLTGPAKGDSRDKVKTGRTIEASGTAGPGTFAAGDEFVITEFDVPGSEQDDPADVLDATLSWEPYGENGNDLELRLDRRVSEGEWREVDTAATAGHPETMSDVELGIGRYRFVAEQFKNVSCQYTLEATFFDLQGELGTFDPEGLFDADGTPQQFLPGDAPAATPKTIGWFNESNRYTDADRPRDGDGHGSHCSSIMAGSGRASVPKPASEGLVKAEPRAALTAGDFLEYEFEAEAGAGVFISAFGDAIELAIEGPDGRTLDVSTVVSEDASTFDNNIAEAPARTTGTYTAYVRPAGGQLASTGRVQTVRAGPFEPHTETAGDRDDGGDPAVHSGIAPDAALVGIESLSDATVSLANFAEEFSEYFNMRAVNMSWGYVGGLPLGSLGGIAGFGTVEALKKIAEGGILPVAAAGNSFTPANGNGAPAVADEAISVVSTGPLDGISSYSSGGLGALDEDGGTYLKPDVTAPGGYDNNEINAALGEDTSDAGYGDVRDYVVKAGTSMASPYTCGTSTLVAQAMEEDAPDSIALPEPSETGIEDVKRLKQVVLATATETAFTAAPYHRAKAPTYDFGGRDPYEGYGRVNPDAAVDAVSNDLFASTSPAIEVETAAAAAPLETDDDGNEGPKTVSTTLSGTLGLNVPQDSRALAGYVEAKGGTLEVSAEVRGLSGGNRGLAKGDAHIDLFVYDAGSPGPNGEPNVAASAMGMDGSASLSVDVDSREFEDDETLTKTYYVVAKLVNVPGVVTGYDVQAQVGMDLSFEAAAVDVEPPEEIDLNVAGSRADDGSVFTGGQTDLVRVTVEEFNGELAGAVEVSDRVPAGWTVDEEYGDVESTTDNDDGSTTVVLGEVSTDDLGSDAATRQYFAEAPTGADNTGRYTFGPATATAVDPTDFSDDPDRERGSTEENFGGTDTNTVVGPSTET
ncbi:hypothetical protein BRC88_11025 [Halobacteriales archaeon QS_4_69_225]|nr:MAG: hypothetical protein BRC88_11025 [Halobacteriales archaeon QS_4_69_225]